MSDAGSAMSDYCLQDAMVRGKYSSYSRCPNLSAPHTLARDSIWGRYGVRLRMRRNPDPPCFHVPVISELSLFMVPS